MSMSVSAPAETESVVWRWVEAFNARDLDGMLACVAEDIDFHPLRVSGLASSYRGRDGVREWFERFQHARHEHRIVLSELREVDEGKVFASGSLGLGDERDIGPFCALHRIADGVIVAAHQYLTDPDMIERLGLIA